MWSIVRASMVAIFSLIMGGALVLVVAMMMRCRRLQQSTRNFTLGRLGALAVTLLQLGYLPNLVIYAMSWTTGAGSPSAWIHMWVGRRRRWATFRSFRCWGAIPESLGWIGYAGLAVSLGAGAVAGWWFVA